MGNEWGRGAAGVKAKDKMDPRLFPQERQIQLWMLRLIGLLPNYHNNID